MTTTPIIRLAVNHRRERKRVGALGGGAVETKLQGEKMF
jgi:hypothetical protein